ncbi:spore cortex biosynthesis protein YabQ [Thermodesulfitimonas autotrophica]|uniref:Spore cortex biosynthesis protein YabQ n=1 Tax=Thermodesulfitimonas autotrophica TaxID=1894989 RepID=A0A3N5BA14_9THEO|nr:spore cortex biosynthesis protein YabQ [Thermodesulfitimonas autotrophica]RPF42495.1 spore cortex biosynthesis protein YabQ [Thermodesulfitimonas autotrophica]
MATFFYQLKGFGLSVLVGLAGGWLYDLYQVSFRLLRLRTRVALALGDTLFWLCLTVLACFLFFAGNTGGVRFYTFLGMLTGFFFYCRFLRRPTVAAATCAGSAFLRFWRVSLRFLLPTARFFRRCASLLRRWPLRRRCKPEE